MTSLILSTITNQTLITSSSSPRLLLSSSRRTNFISRIRTHHFSAVTSSKKQSSLPGFINEEISRVRSSKSTDTTSSDQISEKKKQWQILQAWNVPWDWKIVLYVMTPYFMSILLTGIVESKGLEALVGVPHSQNVQTSIQSTDEAAVRLFMDQLLKTVFKLSVLYVFVSPYQPFPEDIFSYKWIKPFNLRNGWFLWGVGGLIAASTGVLLIKTVISGSNVSQIQNEADSLVRLLPLVGASNISTASLLGILGILAPLCEETIYRGFLLTSLTKWLPVPVSVFLSSVVFTLAHQSPGKSTEIFIFGIVLGLVYSRTRNLLAPITMHACWNLGVIFILIYFQSQGEDIHKYVS